MNSPTIELPVPPGFRTFKYSLIGEIVYHIDDAVAVSVVVDIHAMKRKEMFHQLADGVVDEIASKPVLFMHAETKPTRPFMKSYSWAVYRLVNWTGT